MTKILSRSALGLFELICATMLVGVVILGMFAINFVLSRNNQDFGQRYLVSSETQATLNNILNNASLGVGSAATDGGGNLTDQAILIGQAGMGDSNSFCIHQSHNNTPGDVAGDTWVCYTLSNYQLNSCTMPYVPAANYRGAASCSTAANPTFIGTAFSINPNNSSPPTFANGVFTITIQNCLNDSLTASCNSSGTSTDPANNPEIVKTGTVAVLEQGLG